jgi:hypothetical protein
MIRVLMACIFVLYTNMPALAQMEQPFKPTSPAGTGMTFAAAQGLSEAKIGSGLKEALQVGTGNAVNLTGRVDGYFRNQAIKILMPKQLQAVESGLRALGYGEQVDAFVLSMNRAAEKAAPAARQIFWDAIREMSFEDARRILTGGDTAATQYFEKKTTQKLTKAFSPVVERSMNEVGVVRQYNALVGQYQNLPLVQNVAFDITGYVVGEALDGLFYMVGQEEKKIRKNPAARVTELLQQVFK